MTMHATAPPPMRRAWHPGARMVLFGGAVALAALVAFGSYRFFDSYPKDARVDAGAVGRFPAHTVTYIPAAHAFLVHQGAGEYVALYDKSPWLQSVHPAGYEQCQVHWYAVPAPEPIPFSSGGRMADIGWDNYARSTSGDRGVFVENCSGWAFDVDGNHLFGASTALDRYAVQISGGRVVIDTADKARTTARGGWPASAPAQ
jgi:hypothetical protein